MYVCGVILRKTRRLVLYAILDFLHSGYWDFVKIILPNKGYKEMQNYISVMNEATYVVLGVFINNFER